MADAGEPGLQQRCVCRDRRERQTDADRKQAELPQIGIARRRIAPGRWQSDRQRQQGQQSEAKMDDGGTAR